MTLAEPKTKTSFAKRLQGKVAVVTGGSRGIGAAIAKRLADEGATVAITYTKNKKAADEVVASIAKDGNAISAYKADASSVEEIQALVDQLKNTLGKIDILVNNAGVWGGSPITEAKVEQFDEIFSVNVRGLIATTIAALPLIPEGGRIINISSVAATTAMAGMSIYSASKAAVDSLTRIWAQDLGPRKITVNAVAPGVTVSDMMNQALDGDTIQFAISKTPLGRLGTGEDIAAAVAFLASEDGGWTTGVSLRSDGGINF